MASPTSSARKVEFREYPVKKELGNSPSKEEKELVRDFLDMKIVEVSTEPLQPKKPTKKTLSRTVSGLLDKKIKKDSSKTETSQLWQEAKKRWPSSTSEVNSATDYQEFRKEYSEEIFPNLISSGESLEEILDEIEWRSANVKVWSAWLRSNSKAGSFQEFANQNSDWVAYCEMVTSQTRAYRKSSAWEDYNSSKK